MKEVFIVSDNILSPLGFTTEENFSMLKKGASGIKAWDDISIFPQPFYASLFEKEARFLNEGSDTDYTKFEQLLIASIKNAIENTAVDITNKKTALIISTTKGNISLLETDADDPNLAQRIALHHSAKKVADYFKNPNQPMVISNACISGVVAIITGMRLIQSGQFDNVVVTGADVISKFILSGFQSFQAVSSEPCKPFDKNRNGITLGEGAATVVLSGIKQNTAESIKVLGGAISNDANHISGPSRTGEELFYSIQKTLESSGVSAEDIDLISSHGTATVYNDEMEAKAINLANMNTVPVNSLKGYFGHTLGAAGLIESIISIQSMKENLALPTLGFSESGVSKPLNICDSLKSVTINNCLKTASGFGGCNASIIFSKQ